MDPLFLHKSLPVFLLPFGASLLLLVAALRWRSRTLIAIPLALLWIFSTPAIADRLMRSLEDRYADRADAAYPEADAVFALGGAILGARGHPGGEIVWGSSGERFERALSLYKSGRARILVISAEGRPLPGTIGEGALLREIAIERGVPPDSIILTRETINTAAEADALTELAALQSWKRVLLVTSAVHLPRAMQLFRECPAEVIPVPVDYQTTPPGQPHGSATLGQYLPDPEALARSEQALREYLGILFYSVVRN